MATYILNRYSKVWEKISDDLKLEDYGRKLCQEEAYHDNDVGYSHCVEFWRDGIRTYAYAEYDSYDSRFGSCGEMSEYVYGDLDTIHKSGMLRSSYVKAYKYSPDRDWILIK